MVPSFVFTDFEGYFEEPNKLVADPTECLEVAPSNKSQQKPLQSIHNELQRKEQGVKEFGHFILIFCVKIQIYHKIILHFKDIEGCFALATKMAFFH